MKVWQKPNILYYAHLKFINLDYTDYDNPPSNANVMEHWYSNWDVKRREILLYIEFGVSPNGGKTIWWNGLESNPNIGGTIGAKLVARGITTIVPNDINKYLTATLLNYSTKPGNVMVNQKVNPWITDITYLHLLLQFMVLKHSNM